MTDIDQELLEHRLKELNQQRNSCLDDISHAERDSGRPHPNRELWRAKGERFKELNARIAYFQNLIKSSD